MSHAPKTMRAVLQTKPGGPETMYLGEAPVPIARERDLLLKVAGTAINRADTLQREGEYPVPAGSSPIMGLECVGTVVELGAKCEGKFKIGDRVLALLPHAGGYAEYVTVHEGTVMPMPANMEWREASGVPEVFLTGYLISRMLGGMKEGDVVLIHAGGSGVGTALIQLCKLFGAIPIVTVGSQKKASYCKDLGAAHAVNYKDAHWAKSVIDFCGSLTPARKGVNIVLDPVGGSHAHSNLECLTQDGRWILYGTMGGGVVEGFPLAQVLMKRIRLEGTTLRSRTEEYKAHLVSEFTRECLSGFTDGRLKPIIETQLPLEHIAEAHKLMEKNETIGKIVIAVEGEARN